MKGLALLLLVLLAPSAARAAPEDSEVVLHCTVCSDQLKKDLDACKGSSASSEALDLCNADAQSKAAACVQKSAGQCNFDLLMDQDAKKP